ncbi:unknown [Eubacterium sp. CAG:115]|nr:unknown [Eubacterium sp. CAG:115]
MKFSEEYKKSAENINPDRQTIDRMKAAVLKELQEQPDAPAQPLEEPKKPLPLRRIAYIGGAVAACAAITVAAVNLVPSLKASNAMISSGAIADSSASAAEIAGNETAAPEFSMIQNAATAGSAEDIAEEAAADEAPADEAPADDAYGFDNGIAGTDGIIYNDNRYENENPGAGDAPIPEQSAEAVPAEGAADSISDSTNKGHTNPAFALDGSANEFVPVTYEVPEDSTDESLVDNERPNPESGVIDTSGNTTSDNGSSTEDSWAETLDCCDSTEEISISWEATYEPDDDRGNPSADGAWVIVRSPQGWLTADGERYDAVKNAAPPADISVFYWANSPVENKDFCLVIDGDMLYLFDDQMNYLGGYKKR